MTDTPRTAEWTILVFLNAKNNLEENSFPNFAQMASVGSTDDVHVVVQFGRPRRHYSEEFGAWSRTLRFRVEEGMTPTEDKALMDLGDANMGDPATLVDFVKWGRATFPARRTMLVIWNHGQGWRLRQAPKGDAPADEGPVFESAFRYVSNDDDTGDKLYNRAIQDALLAHLGGERLDVFAFDACLMAMVETAYALRDVSRVMVGSEELEPGTGWNYERWLRPLVAAPAEVDAHQLGRLVVDAFKDEYGDLDQTTQSAIDLAGIPALSAAISAFAETAIPLLVPANADAFRRARAACANYGAGHGLHSIDLGRYMQQIEQSPLDPALRERAAEVRARLGEAVHANYASALRQGRFGSHGLAIYFPDCGYSFQSDPDGDGYDLDNRRFPVEFVQRERWAAFLHKYWELLP